jgi:hypothetical protein
MSICVFFIIFFNIFCNTLLIISNYVLHNWDVPPPPLSLRFAQWRASSLSDILIKENIEKYLVGILVVRVWD